MNSRPILFSRSMVTALLAGRKTQTRRLLPQQPPEGYDRHCWYDAPLYGFTPNEVPSAEWFTVRVPAVKGDRFYVCESHYRYGHWEPKGDAKTPLGKQKWHFVEDSADVVFETPLIFRKGMHNADPYKPAWHRRTGRFMFRKHSRMTLEVKDVRIERLQDISADDAIAEGLQKLRATGRYVVDQGDQYFGLASHNPRQVFEWLWDGINVKTPWEKNPWIIAYTFVTVNANIDQVAA
ncbi:hypothetical protein [uncultured Agrobacterium sp.]|uniref:hypothetical protein n=1 Tax=uncultured Agrobacterium sp. TaxID=157277 RepID=UPI0025DC0580|nr:hypothetical protein [uncultured Agrobacterium sp.]